MLLYALVNNLLKFLDILTILFIFGAYWYDYKKFRLNKDWTGIYISYISWVYNPSWEQYNPKVKRKYLWRPSSY